MQAVSSVVRRRRRHRDRRRHIRVGNQLAGATADANQVAIVSVTGHRIVLPLADLERAVLATHVGGVPLSAGHGAPARLVVPGRRGFWWVKWVTAIDVNSEPWWWQPPFPLT